MLKGIVILSLLCSAPGFSGRDGLMLLDVIVIPTTLLVLPSINLIVSSFPMTMALYLNTDSHLKENITEEETEALFCYPQNNQTEICSAIEKDFNLAKSSTLVTAISLGIFVVSLGMASGCRSNRKGDTSSEENLKLCVGFMATDLVFAANFVGGIVGIATHAVILDDLNITRVLSNSTKYHPHLNVQQVTRAAIIGFVFNSISILSAIATGVYAGCRFMPAKKNVPAS